MTALHRLIPAALLAFLFATPAAAELPSPIAVAADADLIAVYSQHSERRLLRLRFDRAAAKASFAPFGPLGVQTFAAAPKGAFVVYAGTSDEDGNAAPYLFMLDEAGHRLGKPVPSPIGPVATLAISRNGDWVAASGQRGWLALFAVERTGMARRLVARATFGVSAYRAFAYAFRPEGGIMTLTDDWLLAYRANDGSVQRTLDLKAVNRDLTTSGPDDNALFRLALSPRGDRFAVSLGGGPFVTMIFDRAGRRLRPRGPADEEHLLATGAEFLAGGDAVILYGMNAPLLIRMAPLTSTAFGDADMIASYVVPLAGGRSVAVLAEDQAALWSAEGKRLVAPAGLENYHLLAAAAGADDEAIVAAERGGWVDLYTKQGKFVRRVQSGVRGSYGHAALSADGAVVAAFGSAELGVFAQSGQRLWGATHSPYGVQDYFVAVAANGSRIVAAGPGNTLRSWPRDGGDAVTFTLNAGEQVPGRLMGLVVSTCGDAIAVADEKSTVWIAYPADKRVLRVTMTAGAYSVAALPDGTGFAIGLVDGTVVRVSRDGAVMGAPLKASELGAIDRIVVAPDGQSLIVVEGNEISARHLAWDGKVLAGPIQVSRSEHIKGAFFRGSAPVLIAVWPHTDSAAEPGIRLLDFAAPATRWAPFDRPPP